jgi:hypothetical protein
MKLFKYPPSGNCPIQSECYFLGDYFYFRARWTRVTIEFAQSEEYWNKNIILKRYILFRTGAPAAGWLPKWLCYLLIFKGFLYYLLYLESDE